MVSEFDMKLPGRPDSSMNGHPHLYSPAVFTFLASGHPEEFGLFNYVLILKILWKKQYQMLTAKKAISQGNKLVGQHFEGYLRYMLLTAFPQRSLLTPVRFINLQLLDSTCTTESHRVSAGKGPRDPKAFISLMRFRRLK